MMHLKFTNINEAFTELVKGFSSKTLPIHTARTTSRNGEVMYVQEPVTLTYQRPLQRVLFNPYRDCNPTFHVFEALWMLAGRNDLAPLQYYVSTFNQFSDDGLVLNGAYGYRWRHAEDTTVPIDQLEILIDHLKSKPDSRRAVLQMWNVEDDLLKLDTSRDVCCNTHAYFLTRDTGVCTRNHSDSNCPCAELGHTNGMVLDMTVCNRSNDMILGMLGANAVHFSFLLEYMAAAIGVEVGVYNQFSNNVHVYMSNWKPKEWLQDHVNRTAFSNKLVTYNNNVKTTVPLVKDRVVFDRECDEFVERHSRDSLAGSYTEPFLRDVAQPMCIAFHNHKKRQYAESLIAISCVKADDWRIAGRQWLERRKLKWETRNAPSTEQNVSLE